MANESEAETIAKRAKEYLKSSRGQLQGSPTELRQMLGLCAMRGATFRSALRCVNGKSGLTVRVCGEEQFIISQ